MLTRHAEPFDTAQDTLCRSAKMLNVWESFDFAQDDVTIHHLPFNHYQKILRIRDEITSPKLMRHPCVGFRTFARFQSRHPCEGSETYARDRGNYSGYDPYLCEIHVVSKEDENYGIKHHTYFRQSQFKTRDTH